MCNRVYNFKSLFLLLIIVTQAINVYYLLLVKSIGLHNFLYFDAAGLNGTQSNFQTAFTSLPIPIKFSTFNESFIYDSNI